MYTNNIDIVENTMVTDYGDRLKYNVILSQFA